MTGFEQLLELAKQMGQADILTIVEAPADKDPSLLGRMLIIPAGEQPAEELIDANFTRLVMELIHNTVWQQAVVIPIDYEGHYRLLWDRLVTQPRALVLGAGHISQPLVGLLAMVGYAVTVADDRPEFANQRRFPEAEQVICNNFAAALAGLDLADYEAIIIVTRGHRYDLDCLRTVLKCPAPYTGMIGSQRRVSGIKEMMTEEGVPSKILDQLKAPIGLDIGAQTPQEIALSIVAEIVAVVRKGSCMPLSSKRR
ncbi:XdhC family protein [Anaerospora sp.]|jgi:xanthine dehydrogenase accessory factor|uniref:XdhC family protein n=1 Tax=Anaerospora sp. TaxID=1960278 RepID=UPI0028991299|nr:XdhC family protein [Anaerospora sp.]